MRREFTIQLYDRIEPIPESSSHVMCMTGIEWRMVAPVVGGTWIGKHSTALVRVQASSFGEFQMALMVNNCRYPGAVVGPSPDPISVTLQVQNTSSFDTDLIVQIRSIQAYQVTVHLCYRAYRFETKHIPR